MAHASRAGYVGLLSTGCMQMIMCKPPHVASGRGLCEAAHLLQQRLYEVLALIHHIMVPVCIHHTLGVRFGHLLMRWAPPHALGKIQPNCMQQVCGSVWTDRTGKDKAQASPNTHIARRSGRRQHMASSGTGDARAQ